MLSGGAIGGSGLVGGVGAVVAAAAAAGFEPVTSPSKVSAPVKKISICSSRIRTQGLTCGSVTLCLQKSVCKGTLPDFFESRLQ